MLSDFSAKNNVVIILKKKTTKIYIKFLFNSLLVFKKLSESLQIKPKMINIEIETKIKKCYKLIIRFVQTTFYMPQWKS